MVPLICEASVGYLPVLSWSGSVAQTGCNTPTLWFSAYTKPFRGYSVTTMDASHKTTVLSLLINIPYGLLAQHKKHNNYIFLEHHVP